MDFFSIVSFLEGFRYRCLMELFSLMVASGAKNIVWDIISKHSEPESWLPFLDSRRIKSANLPNNHYFPTAFSSICTDMIEFNSLFVCDKALVSQFKLTANLLIVEFTLSIVEENDEEVLKVEVKSDAFIEESEESQWLANELLTKVLTNIGVLMKIQTPSGNSENSEFNLPPLLSEREPEMNVEQIKRVTFSEGILGAFESKQPVIISDYGQNIENWSSLKDFDWWRAQFGEQTVSFMDFPQLAYDETQTVAITSMKSLLSLIEGNEGNRRFGLYECAIEDVVGLYRYIQPPTLIPKHCPLISSGNIWIGTKNLTSPMHEDGRLTDKTGYSPNKFHNINFQVKGQKRILLAHPDQSDLLYMKPPSIDLSVSPTIEIDVFDAIDFDKYEAFKHAHLYETTLQEGEALYVPRGWWHALQSTEDSINYNVFFSSDDH